jgi:hypothetical protein
MDGINIFVALLLNKSHVTESDLKLYLSESALLFIKMHTV